MSDWEKFIGRPKLGRCSHRSTLSTVTAGLERSVCEECGHVSVRFIAETVKIYPDFDHLTPVTRQETSAADVAERRKQPSCRRCEAPAKFLIPRGLACAEHAWAAASRQDALGDELWIPIRIDQNANAS